MHKRATRIDNARKIFAIVTIRIYMYIVLPESIVTAHFINIFDTDITASQVVAVITVMLL
jgi:hypothetical protein